MSVKPVGFSVNVASGDNSNPPEGEGWDAAINDARNAGIIWARPENDKRSAEDVIDDSSLLSQLGDQKIYDFDGDGERDSIKDMLKDRVGDFERDADAAFRAAQVLEHVEKFDEDGNRIAGRDVGNGRIDGFTSSNDARNGTEAGRLQDFGKYGFSNLKGKLNHVPAAGDDREARAAAEALGIKWERPEGDRRSARDIIEDSLLLSRLGNQSGVKDMLKERVGDFENDADAAYRAVQVLEHVEKFDGDGEKIVGRDVGNGSIDGFTNSGEARNGTEAGRLQDFGKYGFSSLKGKLTNVSAVGDDREARAAAEALGFEWKRPEGDNRSARDIIEDNPLLARLGNQSGVKDMLKERVGDFETDADAAFRAAQVLDRVVMFDGDGKLLTGDGVANASVDGFTNSGEARHDTEAGRLQDFGKYGFSVFDKLKPADEIGSYKDFLEANPDADEASKLMAKYTAILGEYYDSIRGKTDSGDYLTADALKQYMEENTHLSDEVQKALAFWSQPGAFDQLDVSNNQLSQNPDGYAGRGDLNNWFKTHAPKDAESAIAFILSIAEGNAVSNVDTSKFTGEVFEHPENYSAEEKAAVLHELLDAQHLIIEGGAAGIWKDDYSKVSIANRVRSHPDPEKLLADLNDHIQILESDPEVVEFLNEKISKQMTKMLEDNEGLKDALTEIYEDQIMSGKALDSLWEASIEEDAGQQTVLARFYGTAQSYQTALGIEDAAAIQEAVQKSEHNDDFEDYYENSLASGDRLNELLNDYSLEEAASAFSMEVALYNAALDPEFTGKFDTELNENFTTIVQENAFKGATFEEMKEAFGIDGGADLDEAKVEALIAEMIEENPQFFLNEDGTVALPKDILGAFRGNWDMFRQGIKTFDKAGNLSYFDPNGGAKGAYDRGLLHGVSGLFLAGITIARGAGSGGQLTDRQIVDITTGSVQTTTILAEGGIKGYQQYLKGLKSKVSDDLLDSIGSLLDDPSPENLNLQDKNSFYGRIAQNAKKFEEAAKGVGGIAGVAMGAYSIFDGVQSLRKGDTVGGALSITSGSLAVMAGLASAVEGAWGLLASSVPRIIPIMAGALGWVAAGVGVIVSMIPGLIEEGKQQARADRFGDLLGDHLTKYGIDGVKDGDYWDIPEEDWPGYDDGALSGS